MINFITIISFLLDGVISKYITNNSLFLPLLSLISLILIYPYFKDKKRYFKYIIIIGFLYDIVYTNIVFYNVFLFLIIGYFIKFFYYKINENLITNIILALFIIIFYRSFNYLYLLLFSSNILFKDLFTNIKNSIVLNILYLIIIYIIINFKFIKKRFKVDKYL